MSTSELLLTMLSANHVPEVTRKINYCCRDIDSGPSLEKRTTFIFIFIYLFLSFFLSFFFTLIRCLSFFPSGFSAVLSKHCIGRSISISYMLARPFVLGDQSDENRIKMMNSRENDSPKTRVKPGLMKLEVNCRE